MRSKTGLSPARTITRLSCETSKLGNASGPSKVIGKRLRVLHGVLMIASDCLVLMMELCGFGILKTEAVFAFFRDPVSRLQASLGVLIKIWRCPETVKT